MRFHELYVLAGTLAVSGCVIGQDLGETAGEESGSATGSSSGGPSSAEGDASVSQSSTTPQPGDDSSSGSSTGTSSDATDTGEDSGSTDDGIPDDCPLGPDSVRLQWNGPSLAPLDGVQAQFAAALEGACTMQMVSMPSGADPVEYGFGLLLDCTLDGRIDAQAVVGEPYSIEVDMYSADIDPELLPIGSAQNVELRLAADFWGMGWGVWFVLAREDGTILLDVVHGPYTSPTEPGVGVADDVAELLDGAPWHQALLVNAVTTDCAPGMDRCGGQQRAIELGWNGTAQATVEVEQLGMVTTDIEETWYRAHVRTARAYPRPMCTDLPEADYAVTIWAEEP